MHLFVIHDNVQCTSLVTAIGIIIKQGAKAHGPLASSACVFLTFTSTILTIALSGENFSFAFNDFLFYFLNMGSRESENFKPLLPYNSLSRYFQHLLHVNFHLSGYRKLLF